MKTETATAATFTDNGNHEPQGAQLNGVNFDEWHEKVMQAKTYKDKRSVLKDISGFVKELVEKQIFSSVNEAVMTLFYERNGNTEFHSYNDWLNKGFQVKKGATAYPIWARPMSELKKEKGEQFDQENDFHPIAKLFSNKQVYAIQTKAQ